MIDLGDDNLREIVGIVPYGTPELQARIIKQYEVFTNRNLAFDMGKQASNLDLLKVYEEVHKNNKLETPYRLFLKEIFRYSDHVSLLTFRNYSLEKFVDNQMDPRKHVSVDTVRFFHLDHRFHQDIRVSRHHKLRLRLP